MGVDHRIRTRARRLAPLVAAVCVVAVVLGVGLLGGRSDDAVTAASATRPYTFHGLTLDAPESWPLNATNCGVPLRDTVLVPGTVNLCGIPDPPRVSVVSFAEYPEDYLDGRLRVQNSAKTTTTIDGRTVTKITGVSGGRVGAYSTARGDPIAVFVVPSLGISATIQSPERALVERIAGTARFVRTDANGCLARRADLRTLPTGRPPARSGADTKLVPGHPRHVAVCRYEDGGLERSAAVTGKDRGKLVRVLNGLPTGLSVAPPPRTYSKSIVCTREDERPSGYTVVATYAEGPPVTVWVRLGTCELLGASNGTHTGQRGNAPHSPLVKAIGHLVGGGSMPGNVEPD